MTTRAVQKEYVQPVPDSAEGNSQYQVAPAHQQNRSANDPSYIDTAKTSNATLTGDHYRIARTPKKRFAANDPDYINTPNSPATTRRLGSDRSDLTKDNQIRNVRLQSVQKSSMPGAPQTKDARFQKTSDEIFSESYKEKSSIPLYSPLTEPKKQESSFDQTRQIQTVPNNTPTPNISQPAAPTTPQKKKRGGRFVRSLSRVRNVKKKANQVRALTASIRIGSLGATGYIFWQLPFALLSLIALFFVMMEDYITDLIIGADNPVIQKIVGGLSMLADKTAAVFKHVTGITISASDFSLAVPLFYIFWLAVVLYGFFLLVTIALMYKAARIKPFGGEGSGSKYGFFLLALIGHTLPLLNLFPWLIFWLVAVTKNPK